MEKLRPVSMQRIRGALDMQHLQVEVAEDGSWLVRTPTHTLTTDLSNPQVLHFKATSTRTFSGTDALRSLLSHVNRSNQTLIAPKASVEKTPSPLTYTVSAEVSRLVNSGLSELQFSAFCEEAVHMLYSFFGDFEVSAALMGIADD